MEFLNQLNDVQRAAVMNTQGPQIIVAGAGSGKTRVLTYRLAYILAQGLAKPTEILALTFTNKAAKEMKERIAKLVGNKAHYIMMGTFHSIFSRLLRVEAEKIGFTRSYTIYDTSDSVDLLRVISKELKLDDKKFTPKKLLNGISKAKQHMLTPAAFARTATDVYTGVISKVYTIYDERCRKANAMDFSDLLMKTAILFKEHPDVLARYQQLFKYLMIDEYQDTNYTQYMLARMLAEQHKNVCVVGDDAQSIYAFRGADISNILNFQRDYSNAKLFRLEQNYRSTSTIVQAANSVIKHNKRQIPKRVFTENEKGESIYLLEAKNEQEEARKLCASVREQKQYHTFFNKDFAVLYRTNSQSRVIEDELRKTGIPYKVFGGVSFYSRKEVKDVLAYMRLAVNAEDEQALRRVINYPTRGIGKTSLAKVSAFAQNNRLTFADALKRSGESGISARVQRAINLFLQKIQNYKAFAQKKNAYEAASFIAKDSGILKNLHTEKTPTGLSRWENVQELLNAAQGFVDRPNIRTADLASFLAEVSLFTDQDKEEGNDDFVNLMTIHAAKGLEFKSVFVVGMEEGLFPGSQNVNSATEMEEERRLFYVAVTRAEKQLTLSFARCRTRFGKTQHNEPSRFIREIDSRLVSHTTTRGRREGISTIPTEKPSIRRLKRVAEIRDNPSRNIPHTNSQKLAVGVRVVHKKFGNGKVLSLEGNGEKRKATVFFQNRGRKVLLLKFAHLEIVG